MAPPSTRARELLKKAPPRPPQQHRGTSTSSQPRASAGEVRVVSAERENANHKGKGKEVPGMAEHQNQVHISVLTANALDTSYEYRV